MRPASMLALLVIAMTPVAPAQEAAGPPSNVYVIRSSVPEPIGQVWSRAVQKTVEAHTAHEAGNFWATYQQVGGGPELEFAFLFPFNRFAEVDGWKSNRRIVIESLGDDLGRQVIETLDLQSGSTDRILSLADQLSLPREPPRTTPPAFIWDYNIRVHKGKMTEYAALMRKFIRAHRESERGLHWLAYGNAVGGDRDQVVYLIPFDRFADLDSWPWQGEVLRGAYGDRDAARLVEALTAISDTESRIWRMRPTMSRMPE